MNKHKNRFSWLWTLCSVERRWVYMVCAALFALLGVMSIFMAEDVRAATPCLLIVSLLVIQFRWPTALLWFLLLLTFVAIGVGIVLQASMLQDYLLGMFAGVVPLLVLLWARPRSLKA